MADTPKLLALLLLLCVAPGLAWGQTFSTTQSCSDNQHGWWPQRKDGMCEMSDVAQRKMMPTGWQYFSSMPSVVSTDVIPASGITNGFTYPLGAVQCGPSTLPCPEPDRFSKQQTLKLVCPEGYQRVLVDAGSQTVTPKCARTDAITDGEWK